ncbi:hypothetical protein [Hydrogenophaga sp.]|uniref:hypothetical protein n=1 Tax=Hydrogenophaga sp. TaxID=1904254 RepID=UPI003F72BBF5
MATRDVAVLQRIRARRREMAHSDPQAIEVQGTKSMTAADAYREDAHTSPAAKQIGFDPEEFGKAVGEAIRNAVEPLHKRIAVLESGGGKKAAGRCGLVFKGAFQRALDYEEGDVVTQNDRVYVAARAVSAGEGLREGMAGWVLMVKGVAQ